MSAGFRLPTNTQRTAIIGRTGSGKTQFAAWLLSLAPFDKQPYVIVDYKRDVLLNAIDRIEEIRLGYVPKKPGVYIVKPLPDEMEEVNEWLWKVWAQEKVGLYFDEMYNVPDPVKKSALKAVLTQGRSKAIPAICLTQRPAWISRFVFSEADFYAVFHLNTIKDIQKIEEFFPKETDVRNRLPEYNSYWYDVGSNASFELKPAPSAEITLQRFDDRLRRHRGAY